MERKQVEKLHCVSRGFLRNIGVRFSGDENIVDRILRSYFLVFNELRIEKSQIQFLEYFSQLK